MIPAPALEIAVLLWGLVLLLAEAFAGTSDRRGFAIAGIAGLLVGTGSELLSHAAANRECDGFLEFLHR